MKILISNGAMEHNGAERVISILANKFVEMGNEVELLLYYDKPIWYDLNENIKIIVDEKEIGKKNFLSHIKFRKKFIKSCKPDIVISFLANFNMINIVAFNKRKFPLIVADRNDPRFVPEKSIIRLARNILYKKADCCVFQSEKNKKYFSKKVQIKSQVIFNPIETSNYLAQGVTTEKSKKISYVGRIIKQKNPAMLLKAFYLINKKFPEYTLNFYGEGNLEKELIKLAKNYNISDKVIFHGAVKDIPKNIVDSDLFIMTSNYEGMPNALIEAMCIGLPCISTKVSGATDLIKEGINGCLVNINDEVMLAKKIEELLCNEELRANLARNATKVYELVNLDKIISEWINLIESEIQKGKA